MNDSEPTQRAATRSTTQPWGAMADRPAHGGMQRASKAYATSSSHRSLRTQEADVFRRANAALRRGMDAGVMSSVRALADNNVLWTTVLNVTRDPRNALPETLRAAIVSVGLAVQREMERDDPDFDFLITVNEDMAAGLLGQAS